MGRLTAVLLGVAVLSLPVWAVGLALPTSPDDSAVSRRSRAIRITSSVALGSVLRWPRPRRSHPLAHNWYPSGTRRADRVPRALSAAHPPDRRNGRTVGSRGSFVRWWLGHLPDDVDSDPRNASLADGGRHRVADSNANPDVFDDASGVYAVLASLSDGPERTYEWDLSERPVDGWLTVGIRDDTLTFTYAVA